MNEEIPEFDLEQVLGLIGNINDTLTNIKVNILEIQTQNQQVIIESLKQR
ncbi:hypothetical protein LHA31_05055 [Carnobacterium viridans]|uniref:Uncharacterized protein n=1 Tax=Carnobacterium viridans TaxID=174587 RepID=A0A1H1AR43_9LACT|nr:hypothetical protein [Carnobacterium viridans]UDE96088.1 hypothetical protein LHA31_05055 [Carnobacterium viridans]SDQ42084.1 hypothetical protein SAMN04487752_2217 [Carnobacterium viridans]